VLGVLQTGCVDCPERDVVVLQFDHVRGEKIGNIAHMMRNGVRWDRFVAEIAKCEVVCANCHCRRTAARAGTWWKALAS
jgi:hypothetical protein